MSITNSMDMSLRKFQRIAMRDKKVFFNEQGKELEENNRDLFKKTGNIKGTFHPKISTMKERNSKDLIEAE